MNLVDLRRQRIQEFNDYYLPELIKLEYKLIYSGRVSISFGKLNETYKFNYNDNTIEINGIVHFHGLRWLKNNLLDKEFEDSLKLKILIRNHNLNRDEES